MPYPPSHATVSTDWLAAHLNTPDVRIVDASWFFPTSGRDGRAEFEGQHIPGSVYFDINDIALQGTTLPHMVPDAATFAAKVSKLGLGDGLRIIVYDRSGGAMAAARVWWMFRLFGHEDASVLDGGMTKWLREGRPTSDLAITPRERLFTPYPAPALLRRKSDILANLAELAEQVVDARSALRFAGQGSEPWPHRKVGRIPGSLNLPWEDLLDPDSRALLPADTLRARFQSAGVDLDRPISVTCGSGVSSCLLALALFQLGRPDIAVYDGSWAEWGRDDDTPVAP
jgi:thiosulfate/3-mercaptopyruvate sulfurtransferase